MESVTDSEVVSVVEIWPQRLWIIWWMPFGEASGGDLAGEGEEDIGDGPVEHSFKNKGTVKIQDPSSSANSVSAEFHRRQRSWSRGDRIRHRNL